MPGLWNKLFPPELMKCHIKSAVSRIRCQKIGHITSNQDGEFSPAVHQYLHCRHWLRGAEKMKTPDQCDVLGLMDTEDAATVPSHSNYSHAVTSNRCPFSSRWWHHLAHINKVWLIMGSGAKPRASSEVERTDQIRFLAGCRKGWLNQALSSLLS